MSCTRWSLGFGVTAWLLALGGQAAAQTCTSDATCPPGFACQARTISNEPEPDCKPGADCPKPDASTAGPTVVMRCEPKSCNSDSDCAAGMVCHAEMSGECAGAAPAGLKCAPNTPCDAAAAPPPPTCTTTTTRSCVFKWLLPCNNDAECGAGFSCKPSEFMECSGGAGTAGSEGAPSGTKAGGSSGSGSGGATGAPAQPDAAAPMCTAHSSYPGHCRPTVTTCTADTDCPAYWKCLVQPTKSVGEPPSKGTTELPPDAGASASVKRCVSSFDFGDSGYAEGTSGKAGDPGRGGSTQSSDDKAPVPPTSPTGNSTNTNTHANTGKSSGCSVSAGASPGAGLLLGMLAALVATRRRRRH